MQVDYWVKAREGRIAALNAMRRLGEGYGPGRTPRPQQLGQNLPPNQTDHASTTGLRVAAS